MAKDGLTAEEFDILRLKTNRCEIVESLFEPRGNQVAALWRQRSDEQFEAGGDKETVFEICRRHGEFVEIGQQGGMTILLGEAQTRQRL